MGAKNWDEEMTATMIKLNLEGNSASEIAGALNQAFSSRHFSRNAVIGKLHRMGFFVGTKKLRSTASVEVEGRRRKPGPKPRIRVRGSSGPQIANKVQKLLDSPDTVWTYELNPATNVDLMGLSDELCHWPVNVGLYCGAPVMMKRKPYCSIHSRISKDKTRNERVAENDARWKARPTRGRFY